MDGKTRGVIKAIKKHSRFIGWNLEMEERWEYLI